ncbi:small hydrophilic protein [Streptomyces sp. HNM0574]|uniref:small hydrophilic protein n=1 Tax=Streptomyces sp. HNM0574 TaxID=2714954 RepID=UPI001469EB0C|nr:small hydrophilic protein [Streptomyces sp. HNM0574]NLU67685.1 small hydrophilic protein [Streptomyces sp. HNM0574]
MAFSHRMATLTAVVAIPLGIAATSYALTDSPDPPKAPAEVELDPSKSPSTGSSTSPDPSGSKGPSDSPKPTGDETVPPPSPTEDDADDDTGGADDQDDDADDGPGADG